MPITIELLEKIKNNGINKIILSYGQVGDADVSALSDALKVNRSIQSIELEGNQIGDAGASALSDALKVNSSLQYIGLDNNKIGTAGISALSEALKVNTTLQFINLSRNNIGVAGTSALSSALNVNTTLRSINLMGNQLRDVGALALCEVLKLNSTLQSINLEDNRIGDVGTSALSNTLKVNNTLQSVNLKDNKISDASATALFEALRVNHSLQSINISRNFISDAVIPALCETLNVNYTLRLINLDKIKADGILARRLALIEALKKNYTLLQLIGVYSDEILAHLTRNEKIAPLLKPLDNISKDPGSIHQLDTQLVSNHLRQLEALVPELLSTTTPFYIAESYRLLTALAYMNCWDNEDKIEAVKLLLKSFHNKRLQESADLALGLLLSGNLKKSCTHNQESFNKDRCQLVLHGFRHQLDKPEYRHFLLIAWHELSRPNETLDPDAFKEYDKSFTLINAENITHIIRNAMAQCHAASGDSSEEFTLLAQQQDSNHFDVVAIKNLFQFPSFFAAFKETHPDNQEYIFIGQSTYSFIINPQKCSSRETPQEAIEITAPLQASISIAKVQMRRLFISLSENMNEQPSATTLTVPESNIASISLEESGHTSSSSVIRTATPQSNVTACTTVTTINSVRNSNNPLIKMAIHFLMPQSQRGNKQSLSEFAKLYKEIAHHFNVNKSSNDAATPLKLKPLATIEKSLSEVDKAYLLLRDSLFEISTTPASLEESFNEFNRWLQRTVINQSRSKTEAEDILLSELGLDTVVTNMTQIKSEKRGAMKKSTC